MSAPEPKAWEATDDEVLRIVQIECRIGDATEEMNKVFATVARRRAIEELKALVTDHCTYCALGFKLLTPTDGEDGFHLVGPEGGHKVRRKCDAYGIIYRIAAIEAEEA